MSSCRHLFCVVAVLTILGSACTSRTSRHSGGSDARSAEIPSIGGATGGSSGTASDAQGGSSSSSMASSGGGPGGATPASSVDAGLPIPDGNAPVDGPERRDGFANGDAGPDRHGPEVGSDGNSDSTPVVTPTPACTPEQLLVREAPGRIQVAWVDMPEDFVAFLTSFLPLSYIQEHFRFFTLTNGAPIGSSVVQVHVQIEYGCETLFCMIERKVRNMEDVMYWDGPSQAWQVNVDRAEAARRIEAAGCDVSNLALVFAAYNSPITGVSGYLDQSFYPAWTAGGKDVICDKNQCAGYAPSNCGCLGASCRMNADTGVIVTTPASQWGKGPPSSK